MLSSYQNYVVHLYIFPFGSSSSATTSSLVSFFRALSALLDSRNFSFSSGVKVLGHCSTWRIVCGRGRPSVSGKNNTNMAARMLMVPNTAFGSQGTASACNKNLYFDLSHLMYSVYDNIIRPSDVILWHRCGSTWAQVMACCLTTPTHYHNQCWFLILEVPWRSTENNSIGIAQAKILDNTFETILSKFMPHLPGRSELRRKYKIHVDLSRP